MSQKREIIVTHLSGQRCLLARVFRHTLKLKHTFQIHHFLKFLIKTAKHPRCFVCPIGVDPYSLPSLICGKSTTHYFGLPRSSKARSCRLWVREEDSEWDASGEVETCCDGVADEARRGMLNDGGRAAGKLVVSTELRGSGNVNGVVETESVETGGMENTGPG